MNAGDSLLPQKGIGTKNWFHKWHLKLNLWVVFLCSATLTSHAVSAQPPNKPTLTPVNIFIHSNILFLKGKLLSTLLYLAIRSKDVQKFQNQKETDLMCSNYSCPSSTPRAAPANPLLLCAKTIALLLPQQLHPPSQSASNSASRWGTCIYNTLQGQEEQSNCRVSSTRMNVTFSTGQFYLTLHYKLHLREKP